MFVLGLLVAFAAFGEESGVIPSLDALGGKLHLGLYADEYITATPDTRTIDTSFIPELLLSYDWGKFTAFADIRLLELNDPAEIGIQELKVSYKLTDEWQVTLGQIFTAADYSTPAPYDRVAVSYPHGDFVRFYALGVQIKFESDKWIAIGDVTSDYGKPFDAKIWDSPACSGYLRRKFGDSFIAGSFQLSRHFGSLNVDGVWKPTKSLSLSGKLCYEQEFSHHESNLLGLVFSANWRPVKWGSIHVQSDNLLHFAKTWTETTYSVDDKSGQVSMKTVEQTSDDTIYNALVVGTCFYWGKDDWASAKFDARLPLNEREHPTLEASFQLKFLPKP